MRTVFNKFPKFVGSTVFNSFLIFALISNFILPSLSFAQEIDLNLPAPSKIKAISKPYNPATIRAITVNPNDPFLFDFIIDRGDSNLDPEAFEAETQKLVKYFLAALTIPEADLWVNLSPYEQDAMVSPVLGVTELGKDLLIKDYYLKQVTAQLTNPNTPTGKKFWELAYKKAQELYGNTNVPINTFSKVWIVPDQATVLEKDGSAFIAESHLKVFLDQDYTAVKNNLDNKEIGTDKLGSEKTKDINNFSAQIIKEVVLPDIENEVNVGENFAAVRQIYSAAILATWYKARLKESLLGKLYADQNKVAGVNADDMDSGEKIFEKYTAALKTGAYNIIKQDFDLSSQKIVQRKYFSGGANLSNLTASTAIKNMNSSSIANLTPAASQTVQAAVASMQRASAPTTSTSENVSSRFAVASVRVGQTASSSVTAVGQRLQSAGYASMRDLDGRYNEEVFRNLTASMVAITPGAATSQQSALSSPAATVTPAILESLSRMDESTVLTYARRNGYDAKPIVALHAEVRAKVANTTPAQRATAIKTFVPTTAVSPSIVAGVTQQDDSLETVQTIADLPRATFDAKVASLSTKVAPAVINNLKAVRAATETRKPGETAFAVVAQAGINLENLSTGDVKEAFPAVARVTLSQQDKQRFAGTLVKNLQLPQLRKIVSESGVKPKDLPQSGSELERARLEFRVLTAVAAEEQPDSVIAAVGIESAPVAIALMGVANTNNDEELDGALRGISQTTALQIKSAAPQLRAIRLKTTDAKTRATDPIAFMKEVNSDVRLNNLSVNLAPAVTTALVAQAGYSTADSLSAQVDAAQNIVNLDATDISSKGSLPSLMRRSSVTAEDQSRITLTELPKVRTALAANPQLSAVQAIHANAPTLARVINSNPTFVQNASVVRASSQVNAVLAADYVRTAAAPKITEFYKARFAGQAAEKKDDPQYVPVSSQEIDVISTASKAVAERNPFAFASQVQFERAIITQLRESGVETDIFKATALGTKAGSTYDIDQLAQLRSENVATNPSGRSREEANVTAVANYLTSVYVQSYVEPRRTQDLPRALQDQRVTPQEVQGWVRSGDITSPRARAFFRLTEVKNVWTELSGSVARTSATASASSSVAPIQNVLLSVKVGNGGTFNVSDEVLPANDGVYQYLNVVNLRTSRPAERKFNPRLVTNTLQRINQEREADSNFDQAASRVSNVAQLNDLIVTEAQNDPQFAKDVPVAARTELGKLTDTDLKTVGGIDLSADKMGLQIKRDGKGVMLPIADQDVENLRIDGLSPVILDVQPATAASMPFLFNMGNGTQAK